MHDHGGRMQGNAPRTMRALTGGSAGAAPRLDAFRQHRPLLLSVAYRMLGSRADAEDVVQETFLRWQQARDQNIASPRAFLVTITSRLCINLLDSARVRRAEYVGQWLPEPVVTGPGDDPGAEAMEIRYRGDRRGSSNA